MTNFILPPPVGVGNDLYEAFPQKADTVLDTPAIANTNFNDRFPDITTNRVSANAAPSSGNMFAPLPDVSQYDYSNLTGSTVAASSGSGSTMADFFDPQTQSKANGWFNWGAGAITGLPSGNTGGDALNPAAPQSPAGAALTGAFSMDNIVKLFVRALVVILGFIFVAVGLTMLGAKTRMGDSIVREVRRSIPR